MAKITLAEFFSAGKMRAIMCYSREQSDAVRKAFDAFGKRWHSGDSFADLDYWLDADTFVYYSNDCCYGRNEPGSGYEVYNIDDIAEIAAGVAAAPAQDPHKLRVFLREDYQWHDAVWDQKSEKLSRGKSYIRQTNILAVENDPRVKYLQCKKCGEIVKNTKKAIAEHAALSQSSKTCLTCKSLRISDETNLKESYTKNEDGTYTRTKKAICSLTCDYIHRCPQIDSEKARSGCRYRYCKAETLVAVNDIFVKYPGAFDDMATVDALDMSKWQFYYRGSNDACEFKWNGRSNIRAMINNLGIINMFVCHYRSNVYEVVYSKKYDKIFEANYGEYTEITKDDSPFSETYYNELLKIFRNIYKGEN